MVSARIVAVIPRLLRHAAGYGAGITTGITTHTIDPVRSVVFA